MKSYSPKKAKKSKPGEYKTAKGMTFFVGRNNLQNDLLTKEADKNDIWFHVKGATGSHVILVTEGVEPEDSDYTEAASAAAYFSSLSEQPTVPVDYTRVKNIKKPQGSRAGFVTYKTNYTAYVKPIMPKKEQTL